MAANEEELLGDGEEYEDLQVDEDSILLWDDLDLGAIGDQGPGGDSFLEESTDDSGLHQSGAEGGYQDLQVHVSQHDASLASSTEDPDANTQPHNDPHTYTEHQPDEPAYSTTEVTSWPRNAEDDDEDDSDDEGSHHSGRDRFATERTNLPRRSEDVTNTMNLNQGKLGRGGGRGRGRQQRGGLQRHVTNDRYGPTNSQQVRALMMTSQGRGLMMRPRLTRPIQPLNQVGGMAQGPMAQRMIHPQQINRMQGGFRHPRMLQPQMIPQQRIARPGVMMGPRMDTRPQTPLLLTTQQQARQPHRQAIMQPNQQTLRHLNQQNLRHLNPQRNMRPQNQHQQQNIRFQQQQNVRQPIQQGIRQPGQHINRHPTQQGIMQPVRQMIPQRAPLNQRLNSPQGHSQRFQGQHFVGQGQRQLTPNELNPRMHNNPRQTQLPNQQAKFGNHPGQFGSQQQPMTGNQRPVFNQQGSHNQHQPFDSQHHQQFNNQQVFDNQPPFKQEPTFDNQQPFSNQPFGNQQQPFNNSLNQQGLSHNNAAAPQRQVTFRGTNQGEVFPHSSQPQPIVITPIATQQQQHMMSPQQHQQFSPGNQFEPNFVENPGPLQDTVSPPHQGRPKVHVNPKFKGRLLNLPGKALREQPIEEAFGFAVNPQPFPQNNPDSHHYHPDAQYPTDTTGSYYDERDYNEGQGHMNVQHGGPHPQDFQQPFQQTEQIPVVRMQGNSPVAMRPRVPPSNLKLAQKAKQRAISNIQQGNRQASTGPGVVKKSVQDRLGGQQTNASPAPTPQTTPRVSDAKKAERAQRFAMTSSPIRKAGVKRINTDAPGEVKEEPTPPKQSNSAVTLTRTVQNVTSSVSDSAINKAIDMNTDEGYSAMLELQKKKREEIRRRKELNRLKRAHAGGEATAQIGGQPQEMPNPITTVNHQATPDTQQRNIQVVQRGPKQVNLKSPVAPNTSRTVVMQGTPSPVRTVVSRNNTQITPAPTVQNSPQVMLTGLPAGVTVNKIIGMAKPSGNALRCQMAKNKASAVITFATLSQANHFVKCFDGGQINNHPIQASLMEL